MSNIPPPIQATLTNQYGVISESWRTFFDFLYLVAGSESGLIDFVDNTFVSNTKINIDPKGDLYINGLKFVAPTTAGTVWTVDSNDETVWSEANSLADEVSTGTLRPTFVNLAPAGWLLLDDGTIGNESSGATTLANSSAEDLFKTLWDNISDTYCPVSSGRGASAQADFDANKTIALPKILGRSVGVAGSGSGLTTRSNGQTTGTETHTLTESEMPSHSHTYTRVNATFSNTPRTHFYGDINTTTSTPDGDATQLANLTTGTTGSDSAHNNMQPTCFSNWVIKL